jgi:hypothetical protein
MTGAHAPSPGMPEHLNRVTIDLASGSANIA